MLVFKKVVEHPSHRVYQIPPLGGSCEGIVNMTAQNNDLL